MGRFSFGQVVEAYVDDRDGRVKQRPSLIISDDEECDRGEFLWVIAISTKIEDPLPNHHVLVHDGNRRDPHTGLERPSVVKCNWARKIKQTRVVRSLGWMPDNLLSAILEVYDRIVDDPDFEEWH